MATLLRQICPRCISIFKENEFGGTSRLDNVTRICSSCEIDEGMEDYFTSITPMSEWPVTRPWTQADENGNVSHDSI